MSTKLFSMDFRWKVHLLFFVCLSTRLCFPGKYLDSCDSVDFALGLYDYDLSVLQPHFPGYPVYIVISWLFFQIFHHEVWALVLPGVFFGSLTLYPLSFLAKHLFSERVAALTAILYLTNPLCWLQAERPVSDAMGLFFIMLSAYFLYQVFNPIFRTFPIKGWHGLHRDGSAHSPCTVPHPKPVEESVDRQTCLFLGSLALGLGLGVRLSYFPFIALWTGIVFYSAIQRKHFGIYVFYGLMGFVAGVSSWFFPQIGHTGWHSFLQNGLSFSHGHFTDWGGSVVTFGGLERIACLSNSLWVSGLGGWWNGFSSLRIIPSLIIIISLIYTLKHYHFDRKGWFLGGCVLPYMLWVTFGQNVANPRHIIPIIPVILMLIAYGLCKACEKGRKGISLLLVLAFIVSMSIISFKLVLQYHNNTPAPIQLIRFIEGRFNNLSTRIYCSDEKRFFDYYAPQWDVRRVRNATELTIDLRSSLGKPQDILVVHTPKEITQFGVIHPPIIEFEGNHYTDGIRAGLLLYSLTDL